MSVPNQIPIKETIANGVTTVFPYDFYVLAASDLAVYAAGSKASPDQYTVSGIGQTQGGTVTFNVAPVNGTRITLKRETPVRRDTQYVNNGDLLAETFNADFDRLWLSLQEQRANFSSSMTKPVGVGNWQAMNFAIEGLADGTQPQDAINFRQLMSVNGSAGVSAAAAAQSATDAAQSRQAAEGAASSASTSRSAAASSATQAADSATQAASSATQAANSAQAAATSQTQAGQRATAASNSAAAAAQSEVNAATSATKAETEAAKLGNMNNFASSIQSVDTSTFRVDMKGVFAAKSFRALTDISRFSNHVIIDQGFSLSYSKTDAPNNPLGMLAYSPTIDRVVLGNRVVDTQILSKSDLILENRLFNTTKGFAMHKPVDGSFVQTDGSSRNNLGRVEIDNNGGGIEWFGYVKPGAYYSSIVSVPGANFEFRSTGLGYSNNGWQTFSDGRMKPDRQAIANATEKVRQLTGYVYTKLGSRQTGVVAQEVQAVLPEAVSSYGDFTMPDGSVIENVLTLAPGDLVGLLIQCLKEIDSRLSALEDK